MKIEAGKLFGFLQAGCVTNELNATPSTYAEYADSRYPENDQILDILTQEEFAALAGCTLRPIIADQDMSENHIGGDDVIAAVDGALKAVADGYAVYTWYGPQASAMVVGYKPEQLEIVNSLE